MKTAWKPGKALPFLMGACCLVFLQSCLFGLFEEKKNANPDYRRFYVVTLVDPTDQVFLDSTYLLEWLPINGPKDGQVGLSLYQGDRKVWTLADSVPNNGAYAWDVSKTKKAADHRIGPGLDYRVRVTSLRDSGAWDYCPPFVLLSRYKEFIKVLTPDLGVEVRKGRKVEINWQTSLKAGTLLGLQLFKDTIVIADIDTVPSGINSYPWPQVTTFIDEPEGYRFRIYSLENPGIEAYGRIFYLLPSYNGGFVVRSPKEGDSLQDGRTVNIQWDVFSFPGQTASLELYCDTSIPRYLDTITTNKSRSYSWYLQPGYPAGAKCRIKISSVQDSGLFAYSGYFSIKGAEVDSFENDDELYRAKQLEPDAKEQRRTLTGQDRDWIRIAVTKNRKYIAPIRSAMNLEAVLRDSTGVVIERLSGQGVRIAFNADYTGDYYLSITSAFFGSYQIALAELDSLNEIFNSPFIQPDSNTTWDAGASYPITWKPDTLFFAYTVKLSLYRDSTWIRAITANIANSGTSSWAVPVAFPTSNRYRIGMEYWSDSTVRTFSPYFSIKGVTADTFEPDNTRPAAKGITTDGKAQAHSLTGNDTDWVAFDVSGAKSYLIHLTSAQICSVQVFDQSAVLLPSKGGRNFTFTFSSKISGRYFLRIRPPPFGSTESYTLSVKESETDGSLYPAQFLNPVSTTVWSAAEPQIIRWKPDTALFGNQVVLVLTKNNSILWDIGRFTNSAGSATINIPKGLGTSDEYRIRMTSFDHYDLWGFSETFAITAMATDSLEPNDSGAVARTVVPGQGRFHLSLNHLDYDWFRIEAKAKTLYIAEATVGAGLETARLSLYYRPDGGSIFSKTRGPSIADSVIRIQWIPFKDTTMHLSLFANSGFSVTNYGTYDFDVNAYPESEWKIKFTVPTEGQVVAPGDTLRIQWSVGKDVGGSAYLTLWKGQSNLPIIVDGVKSSGTFAWKVPAGLAPGDDYSIHIENVVDGAAIGSNSVGFRVSMAP